MGEQDLKAAEAELRRSIDDLFRRSRILKRLVSDYTYVDRISRRSLARMLPRARRELLLKILRWTLDAFDIPQETRAFILEFEERQTPKRGRRYKLPVDFEQRVESWRRTLLLTASLPRSAKHLQVQRHLIEPSADRKVVSIKRAIETYLRVEHLGRDPTPRELATAQAVYAQRTHRPRSS